MNKAAVLLATLVVASCEFDYGSDQTAASQVPQMAFTGLSQTAIRDEKKLYTMEADSSEVYSQTKQVRLKNLRFQEYDSEGNPTSQGSAETVTVDSDTNNARVGGKLEAQSERLEVKVIVTGDATEMVTWTNKEKILRTGPGAKVLLAKEDGSRIDAQGLFLDMGTNRLELSGGIEGTWTPETKSDDKPDAPRSEPPPPSPSP